MSSDYGTLHAKLCSEHCRHDFTLPRDIEARYRFAREIARAAADLAFSFYQRRQSLAVDFKQGLQDVVSGPIAASKR